MHEFSPLEQNLWPLGGIIAWTIVYLLMIRRGILDKSYGMPVIALCANIAWECYYTFFAGAPLANKIGTGVYLVADLGILVTCIKFGKDDFDAPLIKKYFYFIILSSLAGGFLIIRQFDHSFHDPVGGTSATYTTMLLSILMVAMILRRNSVKGQSFMIGIFILAGDICGYVMNLIAQQTVDKSISVPWVNISNVVIIVCNLVYLLLYYEIAKRDKTSLWKRF